MTRNFNHVLPEKLRNKDKKKFVLWLFILEVVVLWGVGFWFGGGLLVDEVCSLDGLCACLFLPDKA